jgi:glycosyltransferase 2 family protein
LTLYVSNPVRIAVALVIAAAGISLFIASFDWTGVGASLQRINAPCVTALAVGIILVNWMVRALRWQSCLRIVNSGISFPAAYLAVGLSQGVAMLTPGQAGEATKLWVTQTVRKSSLPSRSGSFIAERLIDLSVVVTLTALALLISPVVQLPLWALIIAIVAALVLMTLAASQRHRLSANLPDWLTEILTAFMDTLRHPLETLLIVVLTLISWTLAVMLLALALGAVSVALPVSTLVAITGLTALATILSFTPGGLGVAELSVTGLLVLQGVTAPDAIAVALLSRGFIIVSLVLSGGHWLGYLLMSQKTPHQ